MAVHVALQPLIHTDQALSLTDMDGTNDSVFALKIITATLGLAFTVLGCCIFFRKKYSLINGYEEERRAGRKTEEDAKRVGLIELAAGIILLVAAAVLLIFG